jgi:hypothetical protein
VVRVKTDGAISGTLDFGLAKADSGEGYQKPTLGGNMTYVIFELAESSYTTLANLCRVLG